MSRRKCLVRWLLCPAVLCVCWSGVSAQGSEFAIYRGINISHWLSQSGRRGQARKEYFTAKDVKYLASLGFDHLRLPVDEEQLWDEGGNKEEDAFGLLHDARL